MYSSNRYTSDSDQGGDRETQNQRGERMITTQKQNESEAVGTLPLQYLKNAVLCAIWMLGKTNKVELVGANICPEHKWPEIRDELLSENLVQKFGRKGFERVVECNHK